MQYIDPVSLIALCAVTLLTLILIRAGLKYREKQHLHKKKQELEVWLGHVFEHASKTRARLTLELAPEASGILGTEASGIFGTEASSILGTEASGTPDTQNSQKVTQSETSRPKANATDAKFVAATHEAVTPEPQSQATQRAIKQRCDGEICTVCEDTLILMNYRGNPGPHWQGKDAQGFFQLQSQGVMRFYSFFTAVQQVQHKGDALFVTITRPHELGNEQRRKFVRIVPRPDVLPAMELWYGGQNPSAHKDDKGKNTNGATGWRSIHASKATLLDISAGGAGIALGTAWPESRTVAEKDFFLIRVGLFDPKAQKVFTLLLVAQCVRLNPSGDKENLMLGLEFIRFSVQNLTGAPDGWQKVNADEGVKPLATWIWHCNLVNRPKTITPESL